MKVSNVITLMTVTLFATIVQLGSPMPTSGQIKPPEEPPRIACTKTFVITGWIRAARKSSDSWL